MNLPNLLTLLRIFFVPLLVAALLRERMSFMIGETEVTNEILTLVIFVAAALTDLLDGYLARRWDQTTTVGTLLDPIADKLLVSAALIGLVQIGGVPAWMAIIIIGREFAVTGLRSIAAAEGFTIKASELGKTKMAAQVLAISLILVSLTWPGVKPVAEICLWGVVLFSVISAADYFAKFWRRIDDSIKKRRRRELLQLERERRLERMRKRREAH